MKLWHGGAPGRRPGDRLLPPSESGHAKTSRVINGSPERGVSAYSEELVYATSDREFAEVFALLYTQDDDRPGEGVVYQVESEEFVLDRDLSEIGTCFEAPDAVVLSPGFPVRSSRGRLTQVLHRYQAHGEKVNQRRRAEATEPANEADAIEPGADAVG